MSEIMLEHTSKYLFSVAHLFGISLVSYLFCNPFVTFVYMDVLIPFFISLLKKDRLNLSEKQANTLNKSTFSSLLMLYLHAFATYIFVYWNVANHQLLYPSPLFKFGGILVVSYNSSIVIDTCHELLHQSDIFSQLVSRLALVPLLFTYYPIQHIHVHHKQVGSARDPVTAQLNQNIYQYFWDLTTRCHKLSLQIAPKEYLLGQAVQILWLVFVYGRLGIYGLISAIAFAYVAHLIMQMTEYIEHYGLNVRENGGPVKENISWNTDNLYWNASVFNYQRHSDHHMYAYKMYPTLALTPAMPQFPLPFPQASVLTLVPKNWFNFIHPLLEKVRNQESISEEDLKLALKRASLPLLTHKAIIIVSAAASLLY